MKRANSVLSLLAILAIVVPSLAQAQVQECSPAGVWYGSAPGTSKYVATVIPLTGNTFSLFFEGAYTLEAYGYVRETTLHGKMVKVGEDSYRFRSMELLVFDDTNVPPAEGSLETDVSEGFLEFHRCDDMTYTITLFAYYLGWGHEPFVDEPDGYFLPPGQTIVGTLHRMKMY